MNRASKKKSTQERYIPSTPKQTEIKLQQETLHNEKGCCIRKKIATNLLYASYLPESQSYQGLP